jgi:LPS sulfotransferase NodH
VHRLVNAFKLAASHPSFAVNYLLLRVGRYFGHRQYRKFVVLAYARTGSNLLLEMLNSHPHVYAEREVFQRLSGRSIDDILDSLYCRMPRRVQAAGCKVFYEHPLDDKSGMLWERLSQIKDLYVIHLKRKNKLRNLVSIKIAHQTKVWYETGDTTVPLQKRQISFTESELTRFFEQQRAYETSFADRFRSHRMTDMYYEDLETNPEAEFCRVTDFLGLSPSRFRTTLKKQNPERLPQLITNYGQLEESFRDTEWASFFDD